VYVDGIHTKIGYADSEFEITRVYKTSGKKYLEVAVFEDGSLDTPISHATFEIEVRTDTSYDKRVRSVIGELVEGSASWEALSWMMGHPDPLYAPYLPKIRERLPEHQWAAILFAMAEAPSVEAAPVAIAALGDESRGADDVPRRILAAVLGPKAYNQLCGTSDESDICRRKVEAWLSEKNRRAAEARLDGHGPRLPWWK
jgi:hypothetical protein